MTQRLQRAVAAGDGLLGAHCVHELWMRGTMGVHIERALERLWAAGSVLKRGLEVLTGPTLHLQSIQRAEAERIERQLAERLADVGLRVEGGH